MTLSEPTPTADAVAALRDALGERITFPSDPEYDRLRTPWNLAVTQHPFAVAVPESAEDVVDIVRAAVAAGLRVAPQSTGHGAAGVDPTDMPRTVLVSLARLRGVRVDPQARTARVLGGTPWNEVLAAAAPHGLTGLHGSAGDVSLAGYALSGGLSFYARRYGLAVNTVRSVQMVTADGALVRASADENPDLFWAVRGGSGAFGVVVSMEIDLLPLPDAYAGMLLWPADRAREVSQAWVTWTRTAPETATTTLRILNFPPLPELPPFLAGRSTVVIDGAILETDEGAAALLAELRALEPEIDTFGRFPSEVVATVHMDPPEPSPAVTAHSLLGGLTPEAVDAFVSAATTPGLFIQELRHLGGAAARRPAGAGAIGAIPGEFLAHCVAMAPFPDAAPAAAAAVDAGIRALDPWRIEGLAATFVDTPDASAQEMYGDAWQRLRALKAQLDPAGVLLAAHAI